MSMVHTDPPAELPNDVSSLLDDPVEEGDSLSFAGSSKDAATKKEKRSDKKKKQEKSAKQGAGKAVRVNEPEDELFKKGKETRPSSGGAKTVYIICMCLLSPVILSVVAVIVAIFLAVVGAALVIAGILALALVVLVVAGVFLALTGITYGLIQIVTQTDFAMLAGEYELGLGLVITGVTIIVSSLLYSGATGLIPFLIKKLFTLLKFVFKKIKDLLKRIYTYSTQL